MENTPPSCYKQTNKEMTMSNYDILNTGAVIVPAGEYVQFSFDNLNFRFKASNSDKKEASVNISMQKEGEISYVLIDFINQSPGGSGGFYEPITLASLDGRDLLLIFKNEMMNAEAGVNILLHYTWLLKK